MVSLDPNLAPKMVIPAMSGINLRLCVQRVHFLLAVVGSVWKMSCDRLHLLEEAVPMVQHFHEHHADIGTWLDEISNEVTSLGSSYDNPEQIKKQQDSLKVSHRCLFDLLPVRLSKSLGSKHKWPID